MTPPSQQPGVRKLVTKLKTSDELHEKRVEGAFVSPLLQLDQEDGQAVADNYSKLSNMGNATLVRLACAILHSQWLKPKADGEVKVNLSYDGRPHRFMIPILNQHGTKFFTVTPDEIAAIDHYSRDGRGRSCALYFQIPGGPGPASSDVQVVSMAAYKKAVGSRPNATFPGTLQFDAQWSGLLQPTQVIPGNIMPRTFFESNENVKALGLGVKDTPITMLGEGCAKEAEGMARVTANEVQKILEKAAVPVLPPYPSITREKSWQMLKEARQQLQEILDIAQRLKIDVEFKHGSRARQWQSTFKQMTYDQASNARPGLWSPATALQPNEYDKLSVNVKHVIRPGSTFAADFSKGRSESPDFPSMSALGMLPTSSSRRSLLKSGYLAGIGEELTPSETRQQSPWGPTGSHSRRPKPQGGYGQPDFGWQDEEEDTNRHEFTPGQHRTWQQDVMRAQPKRGSGSSRGGSAYGRESKSPKKEGHGTGSGW